MLNRARLACINLDSMYFDALLTSGPPEYSGKYRSSGTCGMVLTRAHREDGVVCLWEFVAEHIDLGQKQDYRGS